MRVSHRSRGPRTDRDAQARCVHATPAPSAEPRFSVTVSPLGARGPFSVNSWAASAPGRAGGGERRAGLGRSGLSRTAASPRGPPLPRRSSPHLAAPRAGKRRLSALCPQGTEASPRGPSAWPLQTQEASPRQGSASVFSDCKGATLALKSGGHGASPQLSKKQGFLPTCQSHRGHEILP